MSKMTWTATYDEAKETCQVENECQIWRRSKQVFELHPTARVVVTAADGTLVKDLTYVQTKRGMAMVNAVKSEKAPATKRATGKKEARRGCIFITA